MSPHQILNDQFGYKNFKNGQKEIIDTILSGTNVLAVMPTGAGKSICYQIPALMSSTFSVVISPLISLMHDQVKILNKNRIPASYINSSLDYFQSEKVLNNIDNNKIKLLYVAPEKLNNPEFAERIGNLKPEYLFIDEAHCISEWGHSFRPSYRYIKKFAELIGINKISAFTATATPEVRQDIINQLGFENPKIFVYGFERTNLELNVLKTKNKKENIVKLIRKENRPTIIYTSTRKNAENVSEYLRSNKINSQFYHAGLTNELRKIIQDDFLNDNIEVIVATNAFGMGIDKKNVGMVIHYNIPGSIENLYQEFGRAGRDGSYSKTFLFYSAKDKKTQEFLIKSNHPSYEQIKTVYDAILDYYKIAVNQRFSGQLVLDIQLQKLIESKSINNAVLSSALSSLEQNNYFKISSAASIDFSVKFLIDKNQLKNYIKNLYNNELKDFILNLLKFYGKQLFEINTKIDFNLIKNNLGISRTLSINYLNTLNRIGIIDFTKPDFSIKIEMLRERIPGNNLYLNIEEINKKLNHAQVKLNNIIDYVFTKDCRFKFILNYFGEELENYKCGICDNCRTNTQGTDATEEYLSEIIIRTFKEYKGLLSEGRLIGILTGKSNAHSAKMISTYQSCSDYKKDQIENVIGLLKSKGLLKSYDKKLTYNPQEDLSSEISDANVTEKSDVFNYENNLELYNKLREERKIAAKKFSQHEEIICSDKILKKLSREQPTSPSSLLNIKGFNQRMYNKIGLEFLEIITDHKKNYKSQSKAKDLPKHISQTYQLVLKGYNLADIANLLKLPESIVSIQIETIISYFPDEDYHTLLLEEEFKEIKNSIEFENEDLKDIKKKLSKNISYAKIRIVKAILFSQKNFSNLI